jgi:glycosyltransferase involved in cell wall biosynthesis
VIIHTIRNLDRATGGAPVTVLQLLQAMALQSPDQQWGLLAKPGPSPLLSDPSLAVNAQWYPLAPAFNSRSFRRGLEQVHQKAPVRLIHDHGLWLPNNHSVAQFSRRYAIPRVVSTHGMLEPWAWQYKAWKKRLAWHGFQHRDLRTAHVLHATSVDEAERLQLLLPHQPVAVIPWGIELPPAKPARLEPNGPSVRAGRNSLRQVLFLSRLHPKKGLLDLIEAWRQLPTQGWQLIIAGPDEQGHQAVVEQRIGELNLTNITFVGAVDSQQKWSYYRQADIFVLPTQSENFGLVIAESLAAGTPVITTTAAPWLDIKTHNCGWWVHPGVLPLVNALQAAMSLEPKELAAMGQRGQALIQEKYTWSRAADQMLQIYRWLLESADQPECLYL